MGALISHGPWPHFFLTDQTYLAIFVEGHLETVSAKSDCWFQMRRRLKVPFIGT